MRLNGKQMERLICISLEEKWEISHSTPKEILNTVYLEPSSDLQSKVIIIKDLSMNVFLI